VWQDLRKETARRERCAEAACVGTPGWGAPRGKVGQPKVLALRYELGRLFAAAVLSEEIITELARLRDFF
jgi:hypothetical protein